MVSVHMRCVPDPKQDNIIAYKNVGEQMYLSVSELFNFQFNFISIGNSGPFNVNKETRILSQTSYMILISRGRRLVYIRILYNT